MYYKEDTRLIKDLLARRLFEVAQNLARSIMDDALQVQSSGRYIEACRILDMVEGHIAGSDIWYRSEDSRIRSELDEEVRDMACKNVIVVDFVQKKRVK